jgi:ribonuclease P protein component
MCAGSAFRARLATRADFSRVYREGHRYPGQILVLYVRSTEGGRRVGVTAGRRLGGAVVRNRAKRRLREAFRRIEPRLRGHGDLVLVARTAAAAVRFEDIMQEMEALCAAGRLLCADAT